MHMLGRAGQKRQSTTAYAEVPTLRHGIVTYVLPVMSNLACTLLDLNLQSDSKFEMRQQMLL
jgi:hypothetical protein